MAGRFTMPFCSAKPLATQSATATGVWLTASTASPPLVGSTHSCARTSVCVPSTVKGAPTSAGGSVTPNSARKAVK